MFRATICPSSEETTLSMRRLVFVILCGWLSGMRMEWSQPSIPDSHSHWMNSTLHTRQSSTQNNKYQESHKYSCFSWWWANSRPKLVEKRNKHTNKNFAQSWFYLQDLLTSCLLNNGNFAPVLNLRSLCDTEKVVRSSTVFDCSPLGEGFQSWLEHWLRFVVPFPGACLYSIGIQATTISSHTFIGRYSLLVKRLRLYSSNICRCSPIYYK